MSIPFMRDQSLHSKSAKTAHSKIADVRTLVNGEPDSSISVHDRGFLYGDGLFETLAASNGVPLLWDEHYQRLIKGCERVALSPPEESLLFAEVKGLLTSVPYSQSVVKIVITRAQRGVGYFPDLIDPSKSNRIVYVSPFDPTIILKRTKGVSLGVSAHRLTGMPDLAGLKTLSALPYVLLARECQLYSVDEVLVQDMTGAFLEGSRTNFFCVYKGCIYAPELELAGVEGVMRNFLIFKMRQYGFTVKITRIERSLLNLSEEIFLTNSLVGILPVKQFNDRRFECHTLTHRLQELIADAIL
jgi:4-amino-4-deoxychorismate lyase